MYSLSSVFGFAEPLFCTERKRRTSKQCKFLLRKMKGCIKLFREYTNIRSMHGQSRIAPFNSEAGQHKI